MLAFTAPLPQTKHANDRLLTLIRAKVCPVDGQWSARWAPALRRPAAARLAEWLVVPEVPPGAWKRHQGGADMINRARLCTTPEAVWPSAVLCGAMWTRWNTWEISMHTLVQGKTHAYTRPCAHVRVWSAAQLRTGPDQAGEDLTARRDTSAAVVLLRSLFCSPSV